MKNLRTSLSLALIARRNFTCVTDHYEHCVHEIITRLTQFDASLSWTEVDILKGSQDLISKMCREEKSGDDSQALKLHNIVIWNHLESYSMDLATKNDLLRTFDQLEMHNAIDSRKEDHKKPVIIQNQEVIVPDIFIIIPVMKLGNTIPKINPQIKERFWFCQSVFFKRIDKRAESSEWDWDLEECRNRLADVYFDPEVREYVSSLMVFTRSHRLTSLAPLTSRPTYKGTLSIVELAKALVVWNNRLNFDRLYVTPDYVKVAYRKVCYWLVDWETNPTFISKSNQTEHDRRMQISILTGDWYGSEWQSVKSYLKENESHKDFKTTTGFQNKIVEDVLDSVLPPL
ncbi:hypothetical protein PUMCH_000476 [Australozyma saopauloensis]|uniref:Uncharacterized protein n=1 Tax=Australozyma saopauloensis TaxID=291208 RepID=A0AAX4H3U6_9ASCO|nr:hypothetical protein PUMCH_000476 [[Candida] saopauloensis]